MSPRASRNDFIPDRVPARCRVSRSVMTLLTWLTILGCALSLGSASFKLRILHTNDMHARFEQVSRTAGKCSEYEAEKNLCYGGFARVYTALKNELTRAENEGTAALSLNAGDSYQGTIWYTVYKWRVVAHFLQKLPIEAMSLGNHEFDDGIQGLVPFLKNVTVPTLAANINFSREPELKATDVRDYLIVEKNGRKIGVVGYLTPDTTVLADTGNLSFENEIKSLSEKAEELKRKNVSIIVALGHSGYEVDLKIAAEVPDVDVVVGGHSHTFLYTGNPPDSDRPADKYPVWVRQKTGRNVVMVQAYAFTKYLGLLDVTFDDEGEIIDASGNPILLNYEIEQDSGILSEINKWKTEFNSTLQETIGETAVFLDASDCRFSECNLGNLITDAYIHHGVKTNSGPFWGVAGIAIQQAGGIRTSINATATKGAITREDVITSMPFFTQVSVVEMKGKHLLDALEWSVARYDLARKSGKGEFLQVSGIRVAYDLSKPPGARVTSLEVRCCTCEVPKFVPFRMQDTYRVIMPAFLYKGGDNFTMFKKHGIEVGKFDLYDTEVAMKFIEDVQFVYHGLEDRIRFVNKGSSLKSNFMYMFILLLFKFL